MFEFAVRSLHLAINYRLGVFGFMPHPAFGADRNGGFALEDQRLALRWVKENIAAFGGDPDNITLISWRGVRLHAPHFSGGNLWALPQGNGRSNDSDLGELHSYRSADREGRTDLEALQPRSDSYPL